LRGQNGPFYLGRPEERAAWLGEQGVDVVITCPFDRDLAATTARDFIGRLKQRLGLRQLWVGYDFALGRGREGDVNALRQFGAELGFDLQVMPPVEVDGQVVSSRLIRTLLQNGDVLRVEHLLGRPYAVSGPVVHGNGRGQTIGVPTANLAVWPEQLLPAGGVYVCRAWVGKKAWGAATNIGVRPTFDGQEATVHVEAHLLGFKGDLYDQTLRLEFVDRLRGEQRFPDVQALITQIQADIKQARKILSK
jgi:riboflavin kinase/FMN adenylyltransferase